MSLSLSIGPLVSLIAGILILVMPRLLSTIVALYLIVIGVLGLLGMQLAIGHGDAVDETDIDHVQRHFRVHHAAQRLQDGLA